MTMQEALHALEEVKQAINLAYSSGYSAGKQQRPWVGLTDDDWDHIADKKGTSLDTFEQGAVWAANQLKERNT